MSLSHLFMSLIIIDKTEKNSTSLFLVGERDNVRLTDIPVSGGLELKQVQESNILGQWPGRRLGTSLNTTGDHQSQVEVFSV